MDLISIRRTYNNRRNLIFIVCILLICVTLIITTIEVVNNRRAKNYIYLIWNKFKMLKMKQKNRKE